MPKKITNPLRAGLPSKIYLLAFNGVKSGYEMAKKIYGVEKYPPTTKVSPWLKKLVEKSIILKTEDGYISNIEPLLSEIEKTLRDLHQIELLDFDRYVLRKFLGSSEFRSYVMEDNDNIPLNQDFDSARIIMGNLATLSANILVMPQVVGGTKPEVSSQKEFDELWDLIRTAVCKGTCRRNIGSS